MVTNRHRRLSALLMCLLCLIVAESSVAQVWNVWVSEYEPNAAERALLAPAPEIQQQFAEFLQLPDTGLIRMYPPGRRRVISVTDLATGRRPGFGRYARLDRKSTRLNSSHTH